MAARIHFLRVLTKLVLYLKLAFCTEVDFCIPVRLGHQVRAQQIRESQVVFRLSAFKQELYLQLKPDSSFLAAGTFSPEGDSSASNATADLRGCFYSGSVNAAPDSFAALSLCNGLRGGFFYDGMEYSISQTRSEAASGYRNSVEKLHVIRRRSRAAPAGGASTSRCGVPPDTSFNISLDKYKFLSDDFTETVLKTLGRAKRFASVPRFVEVLVVADESMAKFHGDDLKHYLLTLMSVAARLYKHPSILNSINLVVVGFMVINDADKGPKVSSNAALTLRSFCSWQKKLNKHSDRQPEYWDTAILFTKQVSSKLLCAEDSGPRAQEGSPRTSTQQLKFQPSSYPYPRPLF